MAKVLCCMQHHTPHACRADVHKCHIVDFVIRQLKSVQIVVLAYYPTVIFMCDVKYVSSNMSTEFLLTVCHADFR